MCTCSLTSDGDKLLEKKGQKHLHCMARGYIWESWNLDWSTRVEPCLLVECLEDLGSRLEITRNMVVHLDRLCTATVIQFETYGMQI